MEEKQSSSSATTTESSSTQSDSENFSSEVETNDPPPKIPPFLTHSWMAPDNYSYRTSSRKKICPWAEWNEASINIEKWGTTLPPSKTGKDSKRAAASAIAANREIPAEMFDDPVGTSFLPPGFEPATWIRIGDYCREVMPDYPPVIWDEHEFVLDVVTPNKHLMKHIVFQQLISAVHVVCELGRSLILPSNVHLPQTNRAWKPWSLIYSLNKAGPGIVHQPIYNQNGKYVVKLYVMGSWRRVVVDDRMPLDAEGIPLLLLSIRVCEIWPMILSKAILKVLRCYEFSALEQSGINIVTMLTGCYQHTVSFRNSTASDMWSVLNEELPNYSWSSDEPKPASPEIEKLPENTKESEPSVNAIREHTSKKGDKSKNKIGKKSESSNPPPEEEEEHEELINKRMKAFVVAILKDERDFNKSIKNVTIPFTLQYLMLVSQTRDVPLDQTPERPPTPKYKNIRRHLWDSGLNNPPRPIQMVECLSPLFDLLTDFNEDDKNSKSEEQSGGDESRNWSLEKIKSNIGLFREVVCSKSEEAQKVTSGINLKKSSISAPFMLGSSIKDERSWIHIEEFHQIVYSITFFYLPEAFKQHHVISDMADSSRSASMAQGKPDKKDRKVSGVERASGSSRQSESDYTGMNKLDDTEPYYIYIDNVEAIDVFFNFSCFSEQIIDISRKYVAAAPTNEIKVQPSKAGQAKSVVMGRVESVTEEEIEKMKYAATPAVVVQYYSWAAAEPGETLLTVGPEYALTGILHVPAGRHVYRLVITSPYGYALRITSKNLFSCGIASSLVSWLGEMPLRFNKVGTDIAIHFVSALQNFCDGSDAYREDFVNLTLTYCPNFSDVTKQTKAVIQDVFAKVSVEILSDYIGENTSQESVFPWQCFLMNTNYSIKFKRGSPIAKDKSKGKKGKEGSTRKESQYKESLSFGKKVRLKENLSRMKQSTLDMNEYSDSHMGAVMIIQKFVRRYIARKLRKGHEMNSSVHERVVSELNKFLPILQHNKNSFGNEIFDSMLKTEPTLVSYFLFFDDLRHTTADKCASSGKVIFDPSRNGWFILFRAAINVAVSTNVVCRPFLTCPLPVRLQIIENVIDKPKRLLVDSHNGQSVILSSENNYNIIAEGFCDPHNMPNAINNNDKWHFYILNRLIESITPPTETLLQLNSIDKLFYTKEIKMYFAPDDDDIVFNYYLRGGKNHLLTIQFEASCSTAAVSLELFDYSGQVAYEEGKGMAIIPVVALRGDDPFVPSIHPKTQKKKTKKSAKFADKSTPIDQSKKSGKHRKTIIEEPVEEEEERETEVKTANWDRYNLIGRVRHKSWPMTHAQWRFAKEARILENMQQSVFGNLDINGEEISDTNIKNRNTAKHSKQSTPRKNEKTKPKSPNSQSRADIVPETLKPNEPKEVASGTSLDIEKPHLILRLICNENDSDNFEIFYNRDFSDKIKAEKLSWENSDPGRADKAKKYRTEYLSTTSNQNERGLSAASNQNERGLSAVSNHLNETKTREQSLSDLNENGWSDVNIEQSIEEETGSNQTDESILYDESPIFPPNYMPEPIVDQSLYITDTGENDAAYVVKKDKFYEEQNKKNRNEIVKFNNEWHRVMCMNISESENREVLKIDQKNYLFDYFKRKDDVRLFVDVMKENYLIRKAEEMKSIEESPPPTPSVKEKGSVKKGRKKK